MQNLRAKKQQNPLFSISESLSTRAGNDKTRTFRIEYIETNRAIESLQNRTTRMESASCALRKIADRKPAAGTDKKLI